MSDNTEIPNELGVKRLK